MDTADGKYRVMETDPLRREWAVEGRDGRWTFEGSYEECCDWIQQYDIQRERLRRDVLG